MPATTLLPWAQFRATLYYSPSLGEFSGWLTHTLRGPAACERIHRIDASRDYNVVYDELCEEFANFMLVLTESSRSSLPLF